MIEVLITQLLHERCLLQVKEKGRYGTEISEFLVCEISPSGRWMKLQNMNGHRSWSLVDDVKLIEVLKNLKADKPKQTEPERALPQRMSSGIVG